jgi:hypothetical protein
MCPVHGLSSSLRPGSTLYAAPDVNHLVRFCFRKKGSVLADALDHLRDFFGK